MGLAWKDLGLTSGSWVLHSNIQFTHLQTASGLLPQSGPGDPLNELSLITTSLPDRLAAPVLASASSPRHQDHYKSMPRRILNYTHSLTGAKTILRPRMRLNCVHDIISVASSAFLGWVFQATDTATTGFRRRYYTFLPGFSTWGDTVSGTSSSLHLF